MKCRDRQSRQDRPSGVSGVIGRVLFVFLQYLLLRSHYEDIGEI